MSQNDDATYEYDVFISHASEDKESVARPVAQALRQAGLRVWFDEFTLRIGDRLRSSIDRGLASSQFGVVILSPHFFAKRWPQRELDGLTALEMSDGRSRILPVWHEVSQGDVARFSPMLADVLASPSTDLPALTRSVLAVVMSEGEDPLPSAYSHVRRGDTVDLVDLARSRPGTLDGYYFADCHLVGPAVMMLQETQLIRQRVNRDQLWALDAGRSYNGGLHFTNTVLDNCTFDRVGLGMEARELSRLLFTGEWGA